MPELPEVETMCRGLRSLQGRRLLSIGSCRCAARPISIVPALPGIGRKLKGRRLHSVWRLGKSVVFDFRSAGRLVYEPRMTGLVLRADPPSRSHLRVRLRFQGTPSADVWIWDRRGLSTLRWVDDNEWQHYLARRKLGPDALAVSARELEERLAGSSMAIKVALMDQKKIAGIGNLYAAEILHLARIDPRRSCRSLEKSEWRRLRNSMGRVLREAIRYEGSTLGDGTYRNSLNEPGSYQSQHRVYGRAGEPCPRCRGPLIERIVQNQRSTFFCAVCQQ